jgi:hypothetical protein
MSGGFQVITSDLQRAAGVFRRESDTFRAIMPAGGPACPDGGSAEFDGALDAAARLLGLLHPQLVTVIGEHGAKLQVATDNYEPTEAGLTKLAQDLTLPGQV